ncbi:hypothetical protein HPB50_010294 [Hyalomma asiaticum]|uniref:Uncharacterized protein n=1 Tax=Hyalomma asiaticum TaxID=266040 RepID=A0ACB7SKW8_HYAAI|nr:hypothetical protein HPB50_010294 [Hyalomma asiaticum]
MGGWEPWLYAAPFLKWKKTELNKIDTLIRTGLKRVLSLPRNTSTERLLQLGLHNTATELFEAQRNAQISRLSLSRAGTVILLEAGIQPLFMPPEKSQLFTNAKKAITVDPIPRNIHPTHNEGRRKARAKAILDKIKHNETKVLFVDAARYWNRGAYAVSVVDAHGSLVNAATVVTNFTHEAEEMAIAVALRSCTGASVIYSDSRTAIRTFSAALVSSKAAAITYSIGYLFMRRPEVSCASEGPSCTAGGEQRAKESSSANGPTTSSGGQNDETTPLLEGSGDEEEEEEEEPSSSESVDNEKEAN